MFPIVPPTGPFLVNTSIFGFPIEVRWYGVLIIGGAMIAAWVASKRADRRGYNPEDVWNLLLLGLVLGILCARIYYVAFQWEFYAGRPFLEIINPQGGGLAIHGAIFGAVLATIIYTRIQKLPLIEWIDMCLPTMLIGQSIGRWGNFFNQEAYGRPTTLPFGVQIEEQYRQDPFRDMQQYPPNTLFHATFLYESIWNIAGFGLIIWLEKRLKGWWRTGDSALMYAIVYGAGRFWIEGLRTDSLCIASTGGDCAGTFRIAQVMSLLLFFGGILFMFLNHRRQLWANEIAERSGVVPIPWSVAHPETSDAPRAKQADTETDDSDKSENATESESSTSSDSGDSGD